VLAYVFTVDMLSTSEDIDELEYKAKVTLPTGNHITLHQKDKE